MAEDMSAIAKKIAGEFSLVGRAQDCATAIDEAIHQEKAAAAAREREECAKLCETKYEEWCADKTSNAIQAAPLALTLAKAIRAMKTEDLK